MKIFKKAISMVLVFAMLASFAGMTGFTPGIIASAATPTPEYQTVSFGTNNQYSVKVAKTWYKMTFNESGYQPIWNSDAAMDGDYYGIPYGYPGNDLNISITAPEGGAWAFNQFITDRETTDGSAPNLNNGGNSWGAGGALAGVSCSAPNAFNSYLGKTMTRDEHTFERDELGNLFKSTAYKLNSDEKRGFMDVDTIYLVLAYKDTDGATKFGYIDVAVEFAPSSPASTTSSTKPVDSKAGIKAAEVSIDMPTVLYTNSSGVITNSISSFLNTTTPLDTTLGITLPSSNVVSATLKAVNSSSDSTVYKTWNLSAGSNTVNFNGITASTITNGNAYLTLRLDYTMTVDNIPYNTPTGNILDSTYDEAASLGKSAYYDNTYGDKSAPDKVEVTYTQYIACVVTALPTYYQVAWQTDVGAKYSVGQSLAAVVLMDMAPALASNGINLYGSVRSGQNNDHSNAALRENSFESRTNISTTSTPNALVWYNSESQGNTGEGKGLYVSGQWATNGKCDSNRTIGATIYYDPQVTSAINFSIKYDFTKSNHELNDDNISGYWLSWSPSDVKRAGYEVTKDGVAGTYLGDGITKHGTSEAADSGGKSSYSYNNKEVVTKTGGTYPAVGSGMNYTSSDTPVHFSFNLANATASGYPYWRCVQQINRTTYKNWIGAGTNVRAVWGFHLDAIAVDRGEEHKVITAAISNNFVQAEMDPTWWSEYRDEVIFAYIDLGDLKNDHGFEAQFDDAIANGYATTAPVYKTANISELEAAILRTPAYDRGTSQRDANLAEFGLVPVGSKYGDVIAYADGGAQSVDPAIPNATYYNNDTAGNGINNIDNAAFYRYSGTYFYTDETWKPYATERYYALNIKKYPSANLDVFWYGAGYIYGGSGTFCYCYMQSYIDATTDRLNTAYNNLELRTLAEFKMRNDKNPSDDYDGDGVADNVTGGNGAWVKDSNGNQIIGYDAIMAYLASLIPTDTYTYYTTVSDANGNGKIDALDLDGDGYIDDLNPRTAQVYDTSLLEIQLSMMQEQFHEDDTVVAQGLRFEEAIENFLALVEITLKNPVVADNSAWINIFKYINTTLADHLRVPTGIKAVTFIDDIEKLGIGVPTDTDYGAYVLTEEQKTTFNNAINAYSSSVGNVDASNNTFFKVTQDDDKNGIGAQEEINTAIKAFFNALEVNLPSFLINNAGAEAKAVVENPKKFEVYAPNQATNVEKSIYTAESVQALNSAVNAQLNANSYPFLTTKWSTMNATAATIKSWAQLNSVNANGKLFPAKVDTTYLTAALNAAEAALSDGNLKRTITSHTGETVEWNNYSDQSVAELRYVIDQAKNINTNQDYTNQLAVDKLTFALWDEYDDNVGMLLTDDWPIAPRTWAYDSNGNPTGYTDAWGESRFENLFYGDRVAGANGTDEGLKPNTAYYGFLEAEIKGNTIKKFDENGNLTSEDTSYIGTVWKADGSLILNDSGTPVGDRIFKNWSSYMEHYNNAVALVNAKDKTVNEQESVVDDAAKKLYNARNALELQNVYFPNNTPDYTTAKGWYDELAAYVQKTDVTRYGWEYVDVTEEVTDETTGEVTTVTTTVFQKSENPLSSAEQSVYIYNGITPEIEADIAKFKAKYASDSSTEDYDSLEAARALYNSINAALTDPATGKLYTVKKTNDESLIAGMLDLTGRFEVDPETEELVLVGGYIAGTWTVTFDDETGASTGVYATDLLNDTQAGLLQTYLTNAQNRINAKTDATAGFGGQLAGFTTTIFEEVQKPATDLQFATHMRDHELFAFLDYTYTNDPELGTDAQLVSYYYQDGMYTYRLIKESTANEIKKQVNDYFAVAENWPSVYEVHGITWNKDAVTVPEAMTDAIVDGYNDHYVDEEGNPGEAWGEYKGENEKICEILDLVASRAYNYSDALTRGLMPIKSEHYTWLVNNAVTDIGGIDYVLADASAVSAANEAPFNYDVSVNNDSTGNNGWYTAGYGVKDVVDGKYYLYYNDAEGVKTPSWFTDDTRFELDGKLDLANVLVDYGLGKTDEDGIISSIDELEAYTPDDLIFNYYGVNLADIATTPVMGYYVGYNDLKMSYIDSTVGQIQGAIDKSANDAYKALHDLELLPATEAYRDVYNTYLGIMGQHIDDSNWLEGSFSHAKLDENEKELISDVDFKFYNVGQASKLPDNIKYNIPDGAVPPYGIVSRSQYGSFLTQYTTTEEYADKTNNPWYKMEQYIHDFIDAGATVTIDQAAKVNSYNVGTAEDDNYKSIMETLIDEYLSELEFDDLVFDNLDAVVAAFLGDKLPVVLGDGEESISGALRQKGFKVGINYGGNFYPLSYYTDESLLQVAGILRSNNVLKDGVIIEKIINTDEYKWIGETFPLPITYGVDYKGSFYTSTTDQNKIDSSNPDHNSMLLAFLTALNTQLVLRPVKIQKENINDPKDYLTEAIGLALLTKENEAKYDTNHTSWKTFEAECEKAQALLDNVDNYNITHQELFDNQTSALLTAIENLKNALIADNYAPSMTLKTSVGGVKDFYSKAAYAVQLNEADPESYKGAGEKPEEKANPAAGTFFVPNSSGYSLIVYTNELNPRIVINLEDLEQKLADGTNGGAAVMQDAAKKEFISINAVRTSGVKTNVIAGTIVPAQGSVAERMEVIGQTGEASGVFEATSANTVTVTNGSTVKGSSAFAILAPKFVEGTATQAALYTIEARDGSVRSTETGTVNGNNADKFEFGGAGQEPVKIVKDNNGKIAIYIYYYSLKAKDGTDEGINADGSALATPAINGTHVPSALLSGEPGFKGTDWRNGILLQRHFSDSHRVWEYVSEVKKNENNQYSVNGTIGVPVYNDPNFGYLNTGSFYYVLDKNAGAETVDGKVIAEYNSGNNSVAGCMDYDRATAAKTAMIDAINAMTETELTAMKTSGRFYNYGDYYTNEFGEVLKYDNGEPQWVNWAQSLNNKVENGDLVFVHVVDRWGNVVNRIVEITNLDENAPKVSSDAAGAVAITEKGGSGITDIQVHNGDFSLGEFEYQVSQSQNVKLENGQIANKAEVNCASNVLTIVNLVPGKTYYIGAEDNAGNRGTTAVKADANGHIVITINNEIVQTGEDMSIEGNSSIFTLNGTDTIILNSGEASSVIDATMKGNVFANYIIRHYITTKDNVTALKTVNQDGTVEEWTADNATVKDNGDGTVKWTIKRKLAEGEHSYKVYAKVNGEYENFYVPATITATTRTVKLTYTVVGMGKTVMEHSGAASAKNSTYKSTTVPYGSYVTITADTNVEGCEFYYWINNTTDRIISTANVYEFKAVTDIDCVAQFTNGSTYYDGKKLVVYVNNAKNVIERFELADGDNYTVPTGPVLPDYTFKGWSMTKAEVLGSEKDTVIVEPIYELNASNTVTITEGNYTATGAGTYKAEDNQRAVVTISTSAKDGDGKEFLYWIDADTDEIVSYDRTYTFFCVKDTELTPVYGDASTVKAEPIARITEVKFNALSGKVSFFAERSVPEEYMILQTGIVVTKTESIGTNEDVFVVGGASTAAGTSTSTANNGYYSANTAVATGQTVWARAYVIYETADGEIFEAYGPVVSYTVD